ncbi:MAG TPA: DMSO reductase, partial [Ottowia sp.]|nr:DMSO reductase [Ottowia sp.]
MQLRPTRAPAWFTRTLSLRRNARLKPKSTTRTATGINAARVVQKSMGMTGGSFNTREFFHGAPAPAVRVARVGFQGCSPGRCCPARRWPGCWRWPRRRPACWPSAGSS